MGREAVWAQHNLRYAYKEIGRILLLDEETVSRWITRYATEGLAGLRKVLSNQEGAWGNGGIGSLTVPSYCGYR